MSINPISVNFQGKNTRTSQASRNVTFGGSTLDNMAKTSLNNIQQAIDTDKIEVVSKDGKSAVISLYGNKYHLGYNRDLSGINWSFYSDEETKSSNYYSFKDRNWTNLWIGKTHSGTSTSTNKKEKMELNTRGELNFNYYRNDQSTWAPDALAQQAQVTLKNLHNKIFTEDQV